MSKPPVYAKSAFDEKQLSARTVIGLDGIEYQMLPSDFSDDGLSLADEDGLISILERFPASSIHVPNETANIEGRDPIEVRQRVLAAQLAQFSAGRTGRRCLLILHTETHPDQLPHVTAARIGMELMNTIADYPDVDITIENTTAFRHLQDGRSWLTSGHYDAPAAYCKMFSQWAEAGRLGTCLDICHARMTTAYFKAVFSVYGEEPYDVSLRGFFELNAPYLKAIHLAGFRDGGYGRGCHATPLMEGCSQDVSDMEDFLALYDEFIPRADIPVTIEVNEENLLVPSGYEATKALLEKTSSSR